MVQWAEAYPSWDSAFALLFAESGEPERGRRHLRRLMDAGLDSLPVDSEWVELLWLLGEAAMLLDERDAVRAVYDALEPYADLWAVDGYGAACFGQVTHRRRMQTRSLSNPNLPILRLGVTGFESADCSVPARSARDGAGFVRWLLSFRPERSGSLGCQMKPWRPYRRTNLA
jgi:hypothetical protein